MADDPKNPVTPPANPATPPKDDKGGDGGLEATIRRIVSELLPKGRGGAAAAEHDVTAQVEAAVTKVHQGQEAAKVISDLQARLAAVESKAVPERKPKEYRSITTRIWGADDDE